MGLLKFWMHPVIEIRSDALLVVKGEIYALPLPLSLEYSKLSSFSKVLRELTPRSWRGHPSKESWAPRNIAMALGRGCRSRAQQTWVFKNFIRERWMAKDVVGGKWFTELFPYSCRWLSQWEGGKKCAKQGDIFVCPFNQISIVFLGDRIERHWSYSRPDGLFD